MEKVENCSVCTDFKTLLKKNKNLMRCPPDSSELGSHTWTFLHTMAAYYPCNPDEQSQSLMHQFITGLSLFYPCHHCASHLQSDLVDHPPNLKSRQEFSDWMCQMHNRVNARLGKPEFDCSKVFERWRKGTPDCTRD
jgi:FAD-linked sulfhydryl oxidase